MKKIISVVIIVLLAAGITFGLYCKTNSDKLSFKTKNAFKIVKTRCLLSDKYSRTAFDSAVNFYNKIDDKIPHQYAPFLETDHPYVHVNKGDTAVDLGVSAYVEFSENYLKQAGPEGLVIGVEANPKIIDVINKKLEAYTNFKLYNYAIWSENGKGEFGLGDDPDYELNLDARLIASKDDKYKAQNIIEVDLITLDNLLKQENIGKIDYLKMDIEGAELPALQGSIETIKRDKPDLLLSCHRKDDIFDLILFVNNLHLGYKFYFAEHKYFINDRYPYSKFWRNYIVYATVKNVKDMNK